MDVSGLVDPAGPGTTAEAGQVDPLLWAGGVFLVGVALLLVRVLSKGGGRRR